jgi:type IV pilus assembly protein PilM
MFSWLSPYRHSPIGLDIGARWLKMVQLSRDHSSVIDAARIEIPQTASGEINAEQLAHAIDKARQGHNFSGNEVVVALSEERLFMQNIRVQRTNGIDIDRLVKQEAAARIPYRVEETEFRYLEVADVRQANALFREVIIFAAARPMLEQYIQLLDGIGLRPIAIDIEPLALTRSFARQFRRDGDSEKRRLFAHIGYRRTLIVVTQDDNPFLIKYVDLGGKDFDQAVADHLSMDTNEAAALRRSSGDRRQEQLDPEVSRGVSDAIRPVLDRLANEISLCVRYHNVTFRGQTLNSLVIGGGEASPLVQQGIHVRLEMACDISEPFRSFTAIPGSSRRGQWDIAVGLALKELSA